jgi:hypothetical protein
MAAKERAVLHYGGETFDIPAKQADMLSGYRGEKGSITLNLGDGKWLTLAIGPGIPIAIESWT